MQLRIPCPQVFNFTHIKKHLQRSPLEVLHKVEKDIVWKWISIGKESAVIALSVEDSVFNVEIFAATSPDFQLLLQAYLNEWFDLDRNLEEFYKIAREDDLLAPLVSELYGLRVVGVPDLFEALSWAIIGQQVNLSFAYTMKKRLVENYGEKIDLKGHTLWQFPSPEALLGIEIPELMKLSISRRKAEYLLEVAQQMASGQLSKDQLLAMESSRNIEKHLCKIRGIGPWTAHYVLLRCLRHPMAYPVGDAGLQNAVKQRLYMDRKPSIDELYQLAENWKGWEAYATFYLWNGLN